MKRWALIALAIFASWLLDRAGWLKPVLWGGLWLLLALLGLALGSILLDCVMHSLRPAHAPRRAGLFRIVRESFQEAREGQARDAQRQAWDHALQSALQAAEQGAPAALETLAAQGLGDASLALAERQADPASPMYNEATATARYQHAAACADWVNKRANYAYERWETRSFLGQGATPDYLEMARRWEAGYLSGDCREQELAWLYAHGHGVAVDAEKAWYWLAVSQARHSTREPARLPEGDLADLRALLEKRVGQRKRAQLDKQAAGQAHAEFVASR